MTEGRNPGIGVSSAETPEAEVSALQRRVAELEQADLVHREELARLGELVDRLSHEKEEAEQELRLFKAITGAALDGIAIASSEGQFIYGNQAFGELTGFGERILQHTVPDVLDVAAVEQFGKEILPSLLEHGRWHGHVVHVRPDGTHWIADVNSCMFVEGPEGTPKIVAMVRDVTAQLDAEHERAMMQVRLIDTQREMLRQIGTPLIPIAEGVVAMPLIGMLDQERAQQMLEVLLKGITTQRARIAILDVTGVQTVDSQVADALIRAARAANLLGAEVVLTGIGPAIASTLVTLGVDLKGIVVRGTFQSGIRHAFERGLEQRAVRRR